MGQTSSSEIPTDNFGNIDLNTMIQSAWSEIERLRIVTATNRKLIQDLKQDNIDLNRRLRHLELKDRVSKIEKPIMYLGDERYELDD